jgi:tricorn protease
VTSGYLNDRNPLFDPDGKLLYYLSDRAFDPVYGAFDTSWTYANPTRIVAVPLKKDVKSPLATRNNAEEPPAAAAGGAKPPAATPAAEKPATDKPAESADAAAKPPVAVEIDLDGLESRAVILPPRAGAYADLSAVAGKVVFRRLPRSGSGDEASPIVYYDLAERKEVTVLDDADTFEPTRDGKKALVSKARKYAFVELKPAQKFEKPLATTDIEVPVDPRAEWKQMFMDAYRIQRDFFYDPNMHGVDWAEMRGHYLTLLEQAVTRWDVNFVLGEFIGELNASHTYRSGGDLEQGAQRTVGMLGVDWEKAQGAWRIKRIVRGGPWDADARSPLDEPGVDAREGDYVLAVNGVPVNMQADPHASFQGLGGKTAVLTVNASPVLEGARQVIVSCLSSEVELRYRAWIEDRRKQVDQATHGRVGYIYVQSTGVDAQNELMRQFMAQWDRDGLIIDERFNSGGQIPDRFIELLNRPPQAFFAVRDGESWQWPPVGHRGAQVMLINGWSGSGGDVFPTYFRQAGLGPLIGTRTWGGVIGISGAPPLVDGGSVTVPTFRMYDPKGQWFAEGHGVEPDIRVDENPTELARGRDPQLQRAIEEVMHRVAQLPPAPARPAYERRIGGGG